MQTRRFSARALWGFAAWALPLAVVFVLTPTLLRLLGQDRFGVLMLVFVTPLIAAQLDLGIASNGIRQLAAAMAIGNVDAGRTLVTFSLALGLIGAALATAVWFGASAISSALGFDTVLGASSGSELVRACAVWIAISMATLLPGLVARAAQALVWITALQTLAAVSLWLGALLIVRSGQPLTDVVVLGIGLSLAVGVTMAFAMRQRIDWGGAPRFDYRLITQDRRFSAGIFGSQVASMLVYQGDRILISALGSPAIVGAYSLCANVANKTLAAVVALTSFVFPHAAALHSTDRVREIEELSHALNRAVIVLVVPLLTPGWVLATPFLLLWLGEFSSAELIMAFRILWLAFAIPAFAVPIGNILISSGRAELAARFSWLTAIVVLGSMLLLVPNYGLLGATTAMLLGMSTSFLFRFAAQRALGLHAASGFRRFWLGIGLGVVAQGAVLACIGGIASWPTLFAAAAGAWFIFYLVRVVLRMLSPEEAQLLNRLIPAIRGARGK
ncbi:MAG: oligosaccharide flippase family protein [Burkholderiaceae bacterium]